MTALGRDRVETTDVMQGCRETHICRRVNWDSEETLYAEGYVVRSTYTWPHEKDPGSITRVRAILSFERHELREIEIMCMIVDVNTCKPHETEGRITPQVRVYTCPSLKVGMNHGHVRKTE